MKKKNWPLLVIKTDFVVQKNSIFTPDSGGNSLTTTPYSSWKRHIWPSIYGFDEENAQFFFSLGLIRGLFGWAWDDVRESENWGNDSEEGGGEDKGGDTWKRGERDRAVMWETVIEINPAANQSLLNSTGSKKYHQRKCKVKQLVWSATHSLPANVSVMEGMPLWWGVASSLHLSPSTRI